MTATSFKKALKYMLDTGEFDKIIKYNGHTKKERKLAEEDKEYVKMIYEFNDNDLSKISYQGVMYHLKSINVIKDALCIMSLFDTGELKNE